MMPRAAGNDSHYTLDLGNGEVVRWPSVTTIIHRVLGVSSFMVDWAYKLGQEGGESPEQFRNRRAAEGTAAHEFVERYVKGEGPAPETGYDFAFLKFVAEHDPVFTLSERMVYSAAEEYAGTLDLVLARDDAPRVVDVKTKKKSIYRAYTGELVQCRAYASAAQEMGLVDDTPDTAVLILKENGRYTYDERSVSQDLWLCILDTYKQLEYEGLV